MARLEIKLFGEMEVSLDGQLVRFPTQKAKELFAYLVLHYQHAHPRATLVGLLWPDSDEERAKANLRQTLTRLRKALGETECLRFSGGAAQFHFSDFWCDVLEFERALSDLPTESTCVLYRGSFLAGIYEDWVLIEQERLQTLYLEALEKLAQVYAERRDYDQAIKTWQRVLGEVPWHEQAHRHLIELCMLKGDRSAALRQYEKYAEVVRRELSAEPLPEMHMLYENLRKGLTVPKPTGSRLSPEMPFVGREREAQILHTMWERACQGQGQVVLIEGERGVGKTRFVERFMEQMERSRSHFLRGAAYANELPYESVLQAVRQGIKKIAAERLAELPASLRSELARFIPEVSSPLLGPATELPPAEGKSRWFAALTGFFELLAQERPVALFLDDLHWAGSPTLEYLCSLRAQLQGLRVLVVGTYRGEAAHDPSPLRCWLDELGSGRSYQLIRLPRLSAAETAQALELWLGPHTPATSSWLYRQTEGNPLFVRELVHSLLHSQMLSQDEEGYWHIMGSEPASAYLPESVRELTRASLRRLSERERQLVGMMAVLGRSFEFDLCRELVRQPRERLISKLERLCRVGLLVEREGHYQFHHELVRQVIYDDLSAERKRLWHRQIGQKLEELYPQRLDTISAELAEHFEQAQLWEKAMAYAERAGLHSEKSYAYGEARKFFVRALKLLDHLEKPSSLRVRRMKLRLLSRYLSAGVFPTISDIIPALEEVRTAVLHMIALAQELRDDAKLCEAYQQQARVAMAAGNRQAAQEALQRARSLCHNTSDSSTATTVEQIGRLYRQLGEYRQALEAHQRAVQIGVELGDPGVQGKARADIAVIQLFLGQLIDARQNMEQAHDLVQAARNLRLQASVLNNLGGILSELGHYESAQQSYREAYRLMGKVGDQRGVGIVLLNLAALASDQGRYDEALGYSERVLSMLHLPGLKGLEIEALIERGRAHLGQEERELALDFSARAISILEAEKGIATQAECFYFRHYQVLQANQRLDEARIYLQKAYDRLQHIAQEIREETLRTSFLENVSINRQIIAAWKARC